MTAADLEDYTVLTKEPIEGRLKNGGYTMVTPPLPSGGIVVQYLLRILDGKL